MFRLFIALGAVGAVALFWIFISGVLLWHAPVIREVVQVMGKYKECLEERAGNVRKAMGDYPTEMYADPEFYMTYMKAKKGEIEEACIAESGFKKIVMRVIAEADISEEDRARIKVALAEARDLNDLEHIKDMIEEAQRRK